MTSPAIKILILTALAACIYLFITEIMRGQRLARLIQWVRESHPAEWNALPWAARKVNRLGGIIHLYKNKLITDPHFIAGFQAVRPFRRDQVIAFGIAAAAIAFVFVGVTYWGWRW